MISCNKLYSLPFWKANRPRFPEGVLDEDAAVVVSAYLAAKHFDRIAVPACNWRRRGTGESLSNRRTETKSLADRLLSMEQIDALLRREAAAKKISPGVLRHYQAQITSHDLQLFLPSIPKANDEFFQIFQTRGQALLAEADEKIWAAATGKHKEAVRFALSDTRERTIAFLQQEEAWRQDSNSLLCGPENVVIERLSDGAGCPGCACVEIAQLDGRMGKANSAAQMLAKTDYAETSVGSQWQLQADRSQPGNNRR